MEGNALVDSLLGMIIMIARKIIFSKCYTGAFGIGGFISTKDVKIAFDRNYDQERHHRQNISLLDLGPSGES